MIESETPQAFVDFLKSGAEDSKLKRIVFFNSRGGNVVASMTFGHILRELRIAGVVGRFHADGDRGPMSGECLSACVYAMMGAVRRVAPPGSEVALHRMSIVETEGQGGLASADAQFRRRADGGGARPIRPPHGRQSGAGSRRQVVAARHDACPHPRRNAALVVRGQPVLTRVRRAGRNPFRLGQNRARVLT